MVITTIRPDSELYRPWNAPNYDPFWTWHPTLAHIKDLLTQTLFSTWMLNTMIISLSATAISLFCGLLAGYALSRLKFPFAGSSAPESSSPIWCRRRCCSFRSPTSSATSASATRRWALILTYPTFLIPFCTWLMMGYFKSIPKELEECARIDGATALEGDGLHHLPDRRARHPVGRDFRLHLVVERVPLRARRSCPRPSRRRCRSASPPS